MARWVRRRDRAGRVLAVANQAPGALERYGVTRQEADRAAWTVEPAGRRLEGAAAINRVLAELGGGWRAMAALYRARPVAAAEEAFYRWFAAWPLFYSARYTETLRELDALIRDDPKFADAFTLLGETYEQMKGYPQALVHLKHARELGMHAWGLAAIGRVYALMGERDSVEAIIRQLESSSGSLGTYVSPYGTATIYAALGEKDRAFTLLDRAIADRSEDVPLLKIDPRMAPLRDDPRFRELLSRVGLD